MTTRKRDLRPDEEGRYRPRIGWLVYREGRHQPRFNLGTDLKEAEERYRRIRAIYEDSRRLTESQEEWDPIGLDFAEQLAEGKRVVELVPYFEYHHEPSDPELDYARALEMYQPLFPSVVIVPSNPKRYDQSLKKNQELN